jgi:hypothetical protein
MPRPVLAKIAPHLHPGIEVISRTEHPADPVVEASRERELARLTLGRTIS